MSRGLSSVVVLLAAGASAASSAATFDAHTLVSNGAALLHDSPHLFNPSQLRALRAGVARSSTQAIETVLAPLIRVQVAINPEDRVTAKRTRASVAVPRCGSDAVWLVRIENEGYITAPLEVSIAPTAGSNDLHAELSGPRLTGATVEYRVLRIRLDQRGPVDATLVFSAGFGTADLGHRAEVPLLLRCD